MSIHDSSEDTRTHDLLLLTNCCSCNLTVIHSALERLKNVASVIQAHNADAPANATQDPGTFQSDMCQIPHTLAFFISKDSLAPLP